MKILVGLSGGFDSAYTAMLLRDAGHTVEGAVLDMHCYTEVDEAKKTAESLGIPFHTISCRDLFDREVIEDFCDAYSKAQTPNPCIVCNEKVKFRALYDYALSHGFDKIATGHYARIVESDGCISVAMAADLSKDQSYMLYRLPAEILKMLLLPMGNIIKKEAKSEGKRQLLVAAEREESQDICFVKGESHADYIERRRGAFPEGNFVNQDGELLGRHSGIIRYTVGQRKGLGVSGKTRLFIREIDPEANRIVLSDHAPRCNSFYLRDVVFSGLTRETALASDRLMVRVRYTSPLVSACLSLEGERIKVTFSDEIGCTVSPGQSAVFYFEDRVACGGIIDSTSISTNL